jgi:hypothetical protein
MALQDCRWFKEGAQAAEAGKAVADCEYGGGSPKAILWLEGFERYHANKDHAVKSAADKAAAREVTPAVVIAAPIPRAFPGELPEIQIEG